MSKVSYEDFLPEVLPYVRDCPQNLAIHAIRAACIQFCRESLILREELEPITIVVGQAEYELQRRAGYNVASIITASLGLAPLPGKTPEELSALLGGKWRTDLGYPMFHIRETENTIRLVLTPQSTTTDTVNIKVALTPKRSGDYVDDYIHERWAEVIGFGARARLHDTPSQPFTDEDAARRFRKWFESGIGDAKIEANKSHARGPQVIRYNRFV